MYLTLNFHFVYIRQFQTKIINFKKKNVIRILKQKPYKYPKYKILEIRSQTKTENKPKNRSVKYIYTKCIYRKLSEKKKKIFKDKKKNGKLICLAVRARP